ncbi:MAG: acyl-[acyl-carrier-protein] thioesterase [Desulfovibrio sp.]|jgi:acyl-ACP thioesterase
MQSNNVLNYEGHGANVSVEQDGTLLGSFRIRVDECGPAVQARLGTLANYLQEMAWNHAELLGYGRESLLEANVAWVMTRMRLRLERALLPGTDIRIRTWPSGRDKYLAYRDFVIMDGGGDEVGRCTTAWAHMDLEERRMVPLQESAPFPVDAYRSLLFEGRTVPRLRSAEYSAEIISRRSDLDVNGHVNNVHFMEWALESVPHFWVEAHDFYEMDISFRQECLAQETLSSFCVVNEDKKQLLHCVKRCRDDVELVRVRSYWR